MTDSLNDPAALAVHAQRYSQALASNNAYSNFIVRLQCSSDPDLLRSLVRQYALTAEIVLPIWLRLTTIAPGDETMLLNAASAFYSHGFDEPALDFVEQVIALNADSIAALELKAALTPDPGQRRLVFEQILKIDPGNRTAVDNLILLDRPK